MLADKRHIAELAFNQLDLEFAVRQLLRRQDRGGRGDYALFGIEVINIPYQLRDPGEIDLLAKILGADGSQFRPR